MEETAVKELKDRLLDRAPKDGVGCFACAWILEDLHKNGRLTKHPQNALDGSSQFPVEGKVDHLKVEGLWSDAVRSIAEDPAKS